MPGQMESDRIAELEARITELETQLEDARAYAEAAHKRMQTLRVGLTELQARELQAGATLGTAGLDMHTLVHDLELEVNTVGSDDEYARLAESLDEDPARHLPDADAMHALEQRRQLWRRGFITPEDIGDVDLRRATYLWDAIDALAEEGSRDPEEWVVAAGDARRVLTRRVDAKADSLYQLTKRAMETAADRSDGLLRCEKRRGTRYLVGEKAAIQDALHPLYAGRDVDGSNIVVRR